MHHHQPTPEESQAIETGARKPDGLALRLLIAVSVLWTLFQLWVASPLPFEFGLGVFNDTEVRAIHLGFALFLVYAWFPARQGRPDHSIPLFDWLLALLAAGSSIYLLVNYHALAGRAGAPNSTDLVVGCIGILLLLEATRRCLGRPLAIVALVFLAYTFAGPWLPDLLAHKGASLSRVISHQWLTSEGVFGVALGVSSSFIFLFVLFGTMLEQAGGGQWFIRLSFSLVGHLRGGPAKAAVLASGLTGMVSGSSIANVVTTGTFTIPLMKRAGFSATKAGAIEVAASTNGQIMPPVMGAAAFLMVEYLNIPYTEVIRHAFLPALIAYIALFYLIHLEALKSGMQPETRRTPGSRRQRLLRGSLSLTVIIITVSLLYWLFQGVAMVFGDSAPWVTSGLLIVGYVALLYYGQRGRSGSPVSDPAADGGIRSGLYFLIPIGMLVWCLMVLRLSPATSVFYAILGLAGIMLTQRPLQAMLAGTQLQSAVRTGFIELFDAFQFGARNMITIAIATATAGIVVGTVSLTGIGQVLGELIETLSMGSVILMFILTALICMLLGMGLPTTANYIVVSTLMAGVIAQLTASQGLVIPLVAIHLFVFYFGILADDTPPVGLAAYAAAGISGADPIHTGIQSFFYDIRTAILPFVFVFNTDLLLIGVSHPLHYLWIFVTATLAMLLFVAALQGWWLARCNWWERGLLLIIAMSLFRPDFWRDQFFPESVLLPPTTIHDRSYSAGQTMALAIEVEQDSGAPGNRQIVFTLPHNTRDDPLTAVGLITTTTGDIITIDDIAFLSPAEQAGLEPGYARRITGLVEPRPQPNQAWFVLPFLLPLLLLWRSQRRRIHTVNNENGKHRNPD